MGQNFTIDDKHKDVCYDIYKSSSTLNYYNNNNNNNNNDNNNDNNNNNNNDKSKIALNKSNSNLSKITTATNTSGNSTGSYNDIHNYDSYQEDYSSSNEELSNDPWGFFEDIEPESDVTYFSDEELYCERKLQRAASLPPPVTEPPYYILESTLRTQKLWHITAGRRPKQPSCERKAMEKLWAENFKASNVANVVYEKTKEKPSIIKSVSASAQIQSSTKYKNNTKMPLPKSGNVIDTLDQCVEEYDEVARKEFDVDILMRGFQPFSNPCSKSFNVDIGPSSDSISCITLQIPRFRIIKNKNNQEYAEYLVVIVLGGYSSVKFGLWRRYSDFKNLAAKIEHYHNDDICNYSNSLLSWKCLLQRKRWYKSFDQEYLGFKCFLLERFLHDILFESCTSTIISDFLDIV